jgi:amidase
MNEYSKYDASALAELVQDSQVSAVELLDAAIARAEQVNPSLNAIITPLYDYAREQLQQGLPAGPFHGVPFLLKDLLCELEGAPHSQGSEAYKGYISPVSSNLVKRYQAAGLNIFGKTNTPEFGLLGVTEPKAFGATRNPWDLSRSPGGSSGGAAAAVAAGIVPVAAGGDGGGSIRIPAACCGLFGLKPSRGLMPTGPQRGELWDGAVVEHVISRSVRDSVRMLDCIRGPDECTPYPLVVPDTPFAASLCAPKKPLRIGFTTDSFIGSTVSTAANDAVDDASKLLSGLGHQLEPIQLNIDGEQLIDSYLALYHAQVGALMKHSSDILGVSVAKLAIEEETRSLGTVGSLISATDMVLARQYWTELARTMHAIHDTYDVVLTPTMADIAPQIGHFDLNIAERLGIKLVNRLRLHRLLMLSGMVKETAKRMLSQYPFTQLANFTGQPAMSVPLYWSNGMPLGVQLMARLGADHTLIQLATQLEEARPWFNRRPEAFA